MTASEDFPVDVPCSLATTPSAGPPQEVDWPVELQVCIEYCTRSAFHARYDPEKYQSYFELSAEAFKERYPQTKIVGNPVVGRRPWRAFDRLGPLTEDVTLPRLGAFEVTVTSDELGQRTIFSKLQCRRWPNPRMLVVQVERLLRGEELKLPLPSARRSSGGLYPLVKERRFPRQLEARSPRKWDVPKAGASADGTGGGESTPGPSPRGFTPRGAAEEKAGGKSGGSPRRKQMGQKKGERDAKSVEATEKGGKDTKKANVAPDAASGDKASLTATPGPDRLDDSEGLEGTRSAGIYEDDDDGFEEEVSASHSGFEESVGKGMWMPGAAKVEKWEKDDENSPKGKAAKALRATN